MPIVQIAPSTAVGDCAYVYGYNADVDANSGADEDLIAAGATQYWPAAAVLGSSINISSASGDDDGAPVGTGALTVTIVGLDANYKVQSETVTMNGVSNVNPTGSYIRIYKAYVATAGSGGTNAGVITVADGTGTFITIPAGLNTSLAAAYTVPADYSVGHILRWHVGSITSGNVFAVLYTRALGASWVVSAFQVVSSSASVTQQFPIPITVAAKTDIRLTIISASADNLAVGGGFEVMLA